MLHPSLHGSWFRMLALAAACGLVLLGCGPGDPLEEVRFQQDVRRDYAASIETLRELLETRPEDSEVQLRYGLALMATGNASQAIWSLKKALQSDQWREQAGLALAEIFASIGNFDDAIDIYDLLVEADPRSRQALLGRSLAAIRSRRHYETGLRDADRVLEADPDDDQALVLRGLALLGLQRADEASEVIDQLESAHRDDSLGLHGSPGFCAVRATFAEERGESERAEQLYDECLAIFSADPVVVEHAVQFFDRAGKNDRSQEILTQALEKTPANHTLRADLVRRHLARGDEHEAGLLLRAATELPNAGDAAQGWSKLALWELGRGNLEAAVEGFEHARQLAPAHSPELAFAHADALVLVKRYDEALRVAEETGIPAYQYLVRGRVALLQGAPDRAFEQLSEGVRLWPDNAIARYYLAVAAEQNDEFAAAAENYRAAMRVDVNATDAYLRLARIHEATGRLEQARSILDFQPGQRPAEIEAGLLQLEVLARLGLAPTPYLSSVFANPEHRARGVAAVARGIGRERGAAAAVDYLESQEQVDFQDPAHAAALEALVEMRAADDRAAEGVAAVEAALARHPDAAVFHALRGRAASLSAAPPAKVQPHYARALSLDPNQLIALRASARLALAAGDFEASAAFFERALAVEPDDADTLRGAAQASVALGRRAEAEAMLETLLRDRPVDAAAALALATLRHERGDDSVRTAKLAQRAVRFGGGAEATALAEALKQAAPPSS